MLCYDSNCKRYHGIITKTFFLQFIKDVEKLNMYIVNNNSIKKLPYMGILSYLMQHKG